MKKVIFAERIGGKHFGKEEKIYKFEKIKKAKEFVKKHYPDRIILDFGVGEPDDMASQKVINTLCETAKKWENRGYADNGIYEFKKAASKYMKKVYNISLSPDTQINHAIGSKSALSLIPIAFVNPGDIIITTVPGYPILATYTSYVGGKIYKVKLLEENNFYPDIFLNIY
jgi:LL-diaminopimelate aminotransferase